MFVCIFQIRLLYSHKYFHVRILISSYKEWMLHSDHCIGIWRRTSNKMIQACIERISKIHLNKYLLMIKTYVRLTKSSTSRSWAKSSSLWWISSISAMMLVLADVMKRWRKVSGGTMTYYSLLFRDRSLMDQIHWWYFGMFVTCLRGSSSLSEWNLFAKIVMWWCTCFLSASLVALSFFLFLSFATPDGWVGQKPK